MKRGRPQRLSREAILEIRDWYRRWTAVERPKQMAHKHRCHKSLLQQIGEGRIYKDAVP